VKTVRDALFIITLFVILFYQIALIDYIGPTLNITGAAGRLIAFISFGAIGYAAIIFPLILFVSTVDWKIDGKFQPHLLWGILGILFLPILFWSQHDNSYLIAHRFFPSGFIGNFISLKLVSIIGDYPTKIFAGVFSIFCFYQFRYSTSFNRITVDIIKIAKTVQGVIIRKEIGNSETESDSRPQAEASAEEKSKPIIRETAHVSEKPRDDSYEIVNKTEETDQQILPVEKNNSDEIDKNKSVQIDKNYLFPDSNFLNRNGANAIVDKNDLRQKADILTDKLKRFGIDGKVTSIHPGPVITMFEYQPASTVKISKIINLADDLAMAMEALSVRIVAPIPGKGVIGIEVSNERREIVHLSDVIDSSEFRNSDSPLTMALGKDTEGYPIVADLSKMPHLLIAGSTGSGKSVGLNAIITSILYKATPDEVKFLMIDPKVLELSVYDGIPHMLIPVITDPNRAQVALAGMVRKMEYRYALMGKKGVKNIANYNKIVADDEKLPLLVVVIDELADLMMVSVKKVEMAIARLAQMARASGIHLLVATQRPSVDVLTGLIKANFSARIAFKVASKIDSRTIIDTSGSEKLLGKGDMLFLAPGTSVPQRVHGAYISEYETSKVTEFLRKNGEPYYDESLLRILDDDQIDDDNGDEFLNYQTDDNDDNYQKAIDIVLNDKKTSISYLQRKLRIGYNKSARYIEQMEKDGIISAPDLHGRREILFKRG